MLVRSLIQSDHFIEPLKSGGRTPAPKPELRGEAAVSLGWPGRGRAEGSRAPAWTPAAPSAAAAQRSFVYSVSVVELHHIQ